jgi:hypothetical protein
MTSTHPGPRSTARLAGIKVLPLVKEQLELMTMDINVVGVITGSIFAAAAIVPFIVSALRTSLKKRRRADSQSAHVTQRWLVRGVE